MKKLLPLIAIAAMSIVSCTPSVKTLKNLSIEHETEYGGIYIHKTIEEFNDYGYAYGDSVNIKFTNGVELKDLPYYNGYYVNAGETLLVGYPGYDYIKVAVNYGDDIWETGHFTDDVLATISLNKKAKYKDVQDASDIHYYDERERYTSDEEFANYRNVKVGDIKDDILYRSASPCNNEHKRAHFVDSLMANDGVQFIMNLADTDAKIQGYIAKEDFNSPYFLSLYQKAQLFMSFGDDDNVTPLAMNMNYTSKEFGEKVASGFAAMSKHDGPYLIHCLEGKDRTGFVLMVVEALLNASYQEIIDDYMMTYQNYYGIRKGDAKYVTIKDHNIDQMLSFITDGADYTKVELSSYARSYLLSGGMAESDIDTLINKLK